MRLESTVRIIHEPDCPGVIVSTDAGELICNECGQTVGTVQSPVLAQIIDLLYDHPLAKAKRFKSLLAQAQAAGTVAPRRADTSEKPKP